jgi:hypothetical protein
MREVRVLVCDLDFTNVTLKDDQPYPPIGTSVDWLVEPSGSGRFIGGRFVQQWPAPLAEYSDPAA